MEEIFNEDVASEDLKRFEREYNKQLHEGKVTNEVQFNYALCLVRSKYPADIRKGILLLEDVYKGNPGDERRDYIFYLAIGNTRIKEYSTALNYVRSFHSLEPGNAQVQDLEKDIKKRMEREGMKGMAIAAGATIAVGSIVALGIAALFKR